MSKYLSYVLAFAVFTFCPHAISADHSNKTSLFNGKSLAGWHAQGGNWRVVNGEMVGSAQDGAGGWLFLDRGYEDLLLELAFRCDGCDAGILLRNAPLNGGYGRTTGIYVPLVGPDSQGIFRITLDEREKEIDRKALVTTEAGKKASEAVEYTSCGDAHPECRYLSRLENLQVTSRPLAGGWKQITVQVRGDVVEGNPGDYAPKPGAPKEEAGKFGPLALRIDRGEWRVKDIVLTDLTRPTMGFRKEVTSPEFRKVQLTDRFYAEGIATADINHDGVMDIVSGPYAYLGPDFRRTIEIYPPLTYNISAPGQHGNYTDAFLQYAYDFEGNGWPDVLKINFEGAFLYINPRGESRHWAEYKVTDGVSAETTQLADVDGCGKPELLMTKGEDPERVVGYLKPGADVTKPWEFHPISPKGTWGGHGMGYGDVNGDGKVDILTGAGWFEQPAAGAASGLWPFHPAPFGRVPDPFVRGSDMYVYDVNGDGLADVIASYFAHGPGLAWFEQKKSADGTISFTPHIIMDAPDATAAERRSWEETDKSVAFTELHAIAFVDMDGDGVPDIVTGKRWFSHGIDYAENDFDYPAVLYWFKLVRKAGGQVEFVPHLINNYVGLGCQIAAVDVNGDGMPDVLTASRKGVFAFLNQTKKPAQPAASGGRP